MARKMKDSGIEWIGEIPEGWEVAPLKRFASIQTGNTPTKTSDSNYYASTGIPWIKPDNLGYSHSISKTSEYLTSEGALCARIMPPNAVYVCCIGSLGKVGYSSISCACNQQINALIFNDLMFWKYGYYLTIAQESQYLLFGNGNVLQIINSTSQGNIACVLPPLENQRLIACYLDSVYSDIEVLISKAHSSIEEYKKLKQAIITQAVTKGVRGERKMKNCNIGWIKELPSDWGIIPSKYLFKNSDTKKINGDEQLTASQQYGIITQKYYTELTGSKVVLANKGLDDWKHVEPFDFIISLRSFQGGLEMSETTGCITWHYIVLKPYRQIYSYYYKWLFKSEIYIRALQRTCNFIRDGQDLRYSNFVQVPLFEPPLEEQKEIADYLNGKCAEIDKLIAKKEQLVKELESYKKSLIYEVVTGKIEV